MKLEKVPLTILKVVHKEGNGKQSGKAYSFYVASVVDDDANSFNLTIADDLMKGPEGAGLPTMKMVAVNASIEIKPKGFDLSGTLIGLTVLKK